MAHQDSQDDDSVLGTGITTRQIEAFGRKVTTTATTLIAPLGENTSNVYQNAMSDIHRELRRPRLQRSVFSFAQSSPSELVRAKLSTREIQHRALSYIPDDQLVGLPENESSYSLFQGFKATLPEQDSPEHRKRHRRQGSRLLLEDDNETKGSLGLNKLKREKDKTNHKLEMLGIRKNMCSSEILEIDKKIANLGSMRKIVLDRLSSLEDEELQVEQDILLLDNRIEDARELLEEDLESTKINTPPADMEAIEEAEAEGMQTPTDSATFMSQSIYEKLPTPRPKRKTLARRISMPIRHEHFEPGTKIRTMPAHNDMITSLDFDAPFGTLVTAALDDTVRVWDLNKGRCLGLLEGHRASVRCLQVEDNIVATGSIDASIKLWDLSRAEYPTSPSNKIGQTPSGESNEDNEDLAFSNAEDASATPPPSTSSMADCPLFSLEAHVSEITALHFHKETLVSGSADKTLRQWDLVKGRCVQTLDVLWAAAQASASLTTNESGQWRTSSRLPDAAADFVGALQCFDAALACGTADGLIRLWDLRSGQVHRSLVGHTGPITCLQFDDLHIVTGSLDRSIRIWDLRTGSIHDAFAFDSPITSMMFDSRRIVAAAGEPGVKIYDKADGRHWDCGLADSHANAERSIAERVRIKDGFLVEGRRNGEVGVWTC